MKFGSLSLAAYINYIARSSTPRPFHYHACNLAINASRDPRRILTCSSAIRALRCSRESGCHEEKQSAPNQKVYLFRSDDAMASQIEREISSKLSIPMISPLQEDLEDSDMLAYTHCIHIMPYEYECLKTYAIGIQSVNNEPTKQRRRKGKSKRDQMQPIFIDFCPPAQSNMAHRVGGKKQGQELLLKAVAPGKYGKDVSDSLNDVVDGAIVCDLTAGFGQDSMILASGKTSQVHMVERDPIVALLLSDAMRRLDLIAENVQNDDRANTLVKKLSLHKDEAVAFCKKAITKKNSREVSVMNIQPHVCYLDPMFPPRKKSAAVKKNMQILHGLFQTNEKSDSDKERKQEERNLLNEALSLATSRVVVKRPINAPPLGCPDGANGDVRTPSFELKGSMNRFDVYML